VIVPVIAHSPTGLSADMIDPGHDLFPSFHVTYDGRPANAIVIDRRD
jgi:hypothetical protein